MAFAGITPHIYERFFYFENLNFLIKCALRAHHHLSIQLQSSVRVWIVINLSVSKLSLLCIA